jgi:hypothetical protein
MMAQRELLSMIMENHLFSLAVFSVSLVSLLMAIPAILYLIVSPAEPDEYKDLCMDAGGLTMLSVGSILSGKSSSYYITSVREIRDVFFEMEYSRVDDSNHTPVYFELIISEGSSINIGSFGGIVTRLGQNEVTVKIKAQG